MSRILDWFVAPVIVDIKPGNDPRPFRSSCPRGDWQAPRWTSTMRAAREGQTKHWLTSHYKFDGSPDGGWGSGWGTGWE